MKSSHILPAQAPLTSEIVDWLSTQLHADPPSLDHLLVVAPTGEAGRALRLALAKKFGTIIPPKILSPIQLLDALYADEHATAFTVATPAELSAILAKTLMETAEDALTTLLPTAARPHKNTLHDDGTSTEGPQNLTFFWGLNTGARLLSVWDELGRKALSVADALSAIQNTPSLSIPDEEIVRWQEFATLEERFFSKLHSFHLCHPTERRQTIVQNPVFPDVLEGIVLPPLLDAPPALYDALTKLQDDPSRTLHILSLSPESLPAALSFDPWGRALPLDLKNHPVILPLDSSQFTCAADSRAQARALAEYHLNRTGTPTVIGMLDAALLPSIESAFLAKNTPVHNAAATFLRETSLGRIIHLTWSLLQANPTCLDLARFLREADVRNYLRVKHSKIFIDRILTQFDNLQATHLPRTRDDVAAFAKKESKNNPELILALGTIDALLAPPPSVAPRSIQHLLAVLRRLFEYLPLSQSSSSDCNFVSAANAVRETVRACDSPAFTTLLSEDERATLLHNLLASATFSLEAADSSIPLLGWLELPWCTEKRLLIAGFNEGCVPSAIVGDAFLPDPLRAALGLGSNDDRFARDTAIFATLLRTHPGSNLHLFLEKQNSNDDVQKPSRLLFFCDDATLPSRALSLYQDPEDPKTKNLPPPLPEAWKLALPPTTIKSVLRPSEGELPSLGVTTFKTYLSNPFLFFLQKTLGRDPIGSESSIEIESRVFGDLCHEALEAFGKSPLKDSEDPEAIEAFLHPKIESLFTERFKAHPNAPLTAILKLQLKTAKDCLSFFAQKQVERRLNGWRILCTEQSLITTFKGFSIKGKIDRIDINDQTNQVCILDYKTGKTDYSTSRKTTPAAALKPFESLHNQLSFLEGNKAKFWHDLQLPLYRMLVTTNARNLGLPENITPQCEYFALTENNDKSKATPFDLTDAAYDAALHTAHLVILAIQHGYYPILSDFFDQYNEEFQRLFPQILRDGIQQDWLLAQKECENAFLASIAALEPAPSSPEP